MNIRILLACISFFSNYFVRAQKAEWTFKRPIDSLYFTEVHTNKPGYGITIIKNGNVIYNNCAGLSNLSKKIPITNKTIFATASVSKQFTAMCILLLEEDGKIKTTDKIHQYIPELPDYGHNITLNHLLSHTSGIRDHIEVLGWIKKQKRKFYTLEGMLAYFSTFKSLSFVPGEDFAYSNTAYMLLALVVERVSGMPFHEFAKKHIFEPLEMKNTEFSFYRKKAPYNHSMSYNWKNEKFKKTYWKEVNATGATGVYTSLNDLVKWDQNFYANKLGKRSQSLINKMNTSGHLNNGHSIHYGNGQIIKTEQGVEIIKHSGGWNAFNFQYTRIPSLNLSIIVGSNNEFYLPYAIANTLVELIVPNPLENSHHVVEDTHDYSYLEGNYISDNFIMRSIKYNKPNLEITGPGLFRAKQVTIKKLDDHCFLDSLKYKVCFSKNNDDFTWQGGMYFTVPTKFKKVDSVGSVPLNNFAGKYHNNELGTIIIKFKEQKNKLKIISGPGSGNKLQAIASNIFNSNSNFQLKFYKNYLSIGNSRVYNFNFKKLNTQHHQ